MTTTLRENETLIDYIRNQVYVEKTTYTILITASGKHTRQMRKSTIALKLAMELDPKFEMEKQMAIAESEAVLNVLGSVTGRGKVVILDELGVAAGHRDWFSSFNKAIGEDFEMHGFRGLIVLVTSPQERLVDVDVRGMFNMVITITYKNEKEHYVKAKVEERYSIPKAQAEPYSVFFRKRFPDGSSKMIRRHKIYFPPKWLLDIYFKISNAKKNQRGIDNITRLRAKRLKFERETFNPNAFVEEIKKNPNKFIRIIGKKKYISRPMIMSEFSLSDTRARQIKELTEQAMGIGYANILKGNQPTNREV